MSSSSHQTTFHEWANQCIKQDNRKNINYLKLQEDAETFFATLSLDSANDGDNHDDGGQQQQSSRYSSNNNEMSKLLALLLSKLGPVFSIAIEDLDLDDDNDENEENTTNYPPVAGLYVLLGTLKGIVRKSHTNTEKNVGLLLNIQKLLGTFLLERCRIDTNIEKLKNVAIMCFHELLKIQNYNPTCHKVENGDSTEKENEECVKAIRESTIWRLEVAREAVMFSAGASTEDLDQHYVGQLSEFPRLKRTACFNILLSALHGFRSDSSPFFNTDIFVKYLDYSLLHQYCSVLSTFTSFSATCLHGESDPRCLVLLLQILHTCQNLFLPYFVMTIQPDSKKSLEYQFPHANIFDAAAPYYPIKFTPPPNVQNAITREQLQSALFSVFKCYPPITHSNNHSQSEHNSDSVETTDNMIELACRLFLERILPDPDDDDHGMSPGSDELNTPADKLEALEDLKLLLHAQPSYTTNNIPKGYISIKPLELIQSSTLIDLSDALVKTHAEAAKADTNPRSSKPSDEKLLATQCRELAIYVISALEEEHTKQKKDLKSSKWNAVLDSILNSLCSYLISAPESLRGRTSAAFLTSISTAGPETLRRCLRSCLPPFFGAFQSTLENNDQERITAMCYTLAGFFGAVTAMESKRKDRHGGKVILLHPHPLASYAQPAFDLLISLMKEMNAIATKKNEEKLSEDMSNEPANISDPLEFDTGASALYGLENLLLSCPMHVLIENRLEIEKEIKDLITDTAKTILYCNYHEERPTKKKGIWLEKCAHAIGSIIGESYTTLKDNDEVTLIENETNPIELSCAVSLGGWTISNILPLLIESATTAHKDDLKNEETRYDWMALARGCALCKELASVVITSIVKSLIKSLNSCHVANIDALATEENSVITISMALSFIIEKGGLPAQSAWENATIDSTDLSASGENKEHAGFYILCALCGYKDGLAENNFFANASMDDVTMGKLLLPETEKSTLNSTERMVNIAESVIPYLLPCYKMSSPFFVNSIIRFVSPILPPLSLLDNAIVTIALPILSVALHSAQGNCLQSMANTQNVTNDIVYDELIKMIPSLCELILTNQNECTLKSAAASIAYLTLYQIPNGPEFLCSVLNESISPTLIQAIKVMEESSIDEDIEYAILSFIDGLNLISLVGAAAACRKGFQTAPIADNIVRFLMNLTCSSTGIIPVANIEISLPSKFHKRISVVGAQAFGSMLSVEKGGPFWKQRTSFIALPSIFETCKMEENEIQDNSNFTLGSYLIAAHILCCVSLKALGDENVKKLNDIIVSKFATQVSNIEGVTKNPEDVFVNTALGAMVKILSFTPNMILPHSLILINSLLHICCNEKANPTTILMSLQCISAIIRLPRVKQNLNQVMKRKLIDELFFVLDHHSRSVRQAGILVRNECFLL